MACRVRSGDRPGRENDIARFDNEIDVLGVAEFWADDAVGVGEARAQAGDRDFIR